MDSCRICRVCAAEALPVTQQVCFHHEHLVPETVLMDALLQPAPALEVCAPLHGAVLHFWVLLIVRVGEYHPLWWDGAGWCSASMQGYLRPSSAKPQRLAEPQHPSHSRLGAPDPQTAWMHGLD